MDKKTENVKNEKVVFYAPLPVNKPYPIIRPSEKIQLQPTVNPVPGDKIVGYVSRGRGVSVHCVDCPNVKNMEPERLIEAKWDDVISQNFLASLKIYCENKGGILAAVTTIISNMKISITGAFARSDNDTGTAEITVMLEVKSTDQVEDVIKKLKTLPEVIDVHR